VAAAMRKATREAYPNRGYGAIGRWLRQGRRGTTFLKVLGRMFVRRD
jgi:hypothetical protein